MAVLFTSTDHLQGVVTVDLSFEEYQPNLQKELNNYKNKAQLKGFRKGKTSVDLIKKMYGNAILQEVVENLLQKQLFDHLQANDMNILGQPLPNVDQEHIYYNIFSPQSYTFKFDIGYTADLDVKGLDHTFEFLQVQADQETIDTQLTSMRNRVGGLITVDEPVKEEHMLTIQAKEVELGQVKEDGIQSEFSVWVSQIDPSAKGLFIDKKQGDQIEADVRSFHVEKDEAFIRQRYFNALPAEVSIPDLFQLTITEIKANELAPLNQDFYDQAFGQGIVTSEEEAREKLKTELEKQFTVQADALLFRDIQEYLLKENKQELPDMFLKRWLKVQNNQLTDESVEQDYPDFTTNLTWTILREKLVKQFEIKVAPEDIKARIRQQIMGYFGGMALGDLSFMEPTIQKMMQNREQVEKLHDEVLTDKLFDQLKNAVQLQPKITSQTEFKDLMEAARKDSAERRQKVQALHDHNHNHDHDHDHDHAGHDHH